MHLTSIEFSFDPCNIYRDCPMGVGYPADARPVGDSHPCWALAEVCALMTALLVLCVNTCVNLLAHCNVLCLNAN